jgi:hypothetical protein
MACRVEVLALFQNVQLIDGGHPQSFFRRRW